ncbi:peptidase U32 family protein [Tichowtungia aerotolerans]|uniref:U32 family peptidase n=1 Tax=Tichowtungia aerotolerans TaxID=2697043 RepID=A0A6P1M803_9BACT|nr:peptidase U32 family protein [Tichowtungia aerotolerans]QHI69193.1 U32 family peptidase [Tichowtungia aerotolerans]
MSNQSTIELMAPAGSRAALSAAINAGADSVYFGVGKLNMRARSADFGPEDLPDIAATCREAGVKSYLALNTIVYDSELDEMQALCDAAKAAGVSAVIATDIAVIEYARSIGLEVHMSVQANVANFQSLKFYSRWADTVVLARELTLDQVSNIWKRIQENDVRGPNGERVRLELFGHGALCVAVSGKCYMSLAQNGHSANRGACLQTCRRKYRVTDEETGEELVIDNKHVMSPKDLCTVQYLDKIAAAGISVLKLEGRARTADYVAVTTRVYREALDALAAETYDPETCQPWIDELSKVFNRGFWHGGYYCGHPLGEWSGHSHSQATETRDQIGIVSNFFSKINVAEFKLIKHTIQPGDTLLIEGPTTGAVRFTAENLHIDGQPADSAKPGDFVTLVTPAKIRRQDKVFLLKARN